MPMPTTKAPARMTKSMDCLTHETGGTARAKTSPRKHSSSEARLSPARKEPSGSNIRRTRLVDGAGTGQQHDVHGNEDSNPVDSLRPNQADTRLFVFDLAPFGEKCTRRRISGPATPNSQQEVFATCSREPHRRAPVPKPGDRVDANAKTWPCWNGPGPVSAEKLSSLMINPIRFAAFRSSFLNLDAVPPSA